MELLGGTENEGEDILEGIPKDKLHNEEVKNIRKAKI